MCVVAETFLMCDFEGDMYHSFFFETQPLLDMFQDPEQYILRDSRLESVATEKEAFFAEVTIFAEVLNIIFVCPALSCFLFVLNHLRPSAVDFIGICLVNTCWFLLYF